MAYRDQPLGELALSIPRASALFRKYDMDYCCGGKQTLSRAAARKELDVEVIEAELAKLAEKIYGVTVPISGKKSGLQRNNEIFAEMGFPTGYTTIGIWSGEAKATNTALFRQFSLNFTSGSSIGRNNDFSYTICIID